MHWPQLPFSSPACGPGGLQRCSPSAANQQVASSTALRLQCAPPRMVLGGRSAAFKQESPLELRVDTSGNWVAQFTKVWEGG